MLRDCGERMHCPFPSSLFPIPLKKRNLRLIVELRSILCGRGLTGDAIPNSGWLFRTLLYGKDVCLDTGDGTRLSITAIGESR